MGHTFSFAVLARRSNRLSVCALPVALCPRMTAVVAVGVGAYIEDLICPWRFSKLMLYASGRDR